MAASISNICTPDFQVRSNIWLTNGVSFSKIAAGRPSLANKSVMEGALKMYEGAMSAMAVTAAVQLGSPAGYLTAAGGICFYISDNILGFRLLHETKSRVLSGMLLTLYYSAVYLIAAAMYFL